MLIRARQAAKTPQPLTAPATASFQPHASSIQNPYTGLAPNRLANPLGPHANMLTNALMLQGRPAVPTAPLVQQAASGAAAAHVPMPQPTQAVAVPGHSTATAAVPGHLSATAAVPMQPAATAAAMPHSSGGTSTAVANISTGPAAAPTLQPSTGPVPGVVHNSSLSPQTGAAGTAPLSGTASATLAYLLAAKASQAAASKPTAVASGGRGMRLVHQASADVLRVKLRLVDLVQGSTALQPKVS